MKIATWNVNSVRSRLVRLLAWLERVQPDILCLQELKCTEDDFPYEAIQQAGYHAVVFGQKTYNGVAILSRIKPSLTEMGMNDGDEDQQARFLLAEIGGIHAISVYVPNGRIVGSEHYTYKLRWLTRLRTFLETRFTPATPIVVCGDFNVARDEKDAARPEAWASSVLFHPSSREALEQFLAWGLVDVFRQQHPTGGLYSWWDYRMQAFPKNNGLRIDYVLATKPIAIQCVDAKIDREEREGEKPSDHAPVIAIFKD